MQIFDTNGQLFLDVEVDDKSYRNKEIMGDNELTLYLSLPDYIEIPIGAYCEFKAERYYLLNPQNFTMRHTRNWEYTVVMETYQSLTKLAKFKFFTKNNNVVDSLYELKFTLTETPEHFARLFVDNMNLSDPAGGWTVGECITSDAATIDFNHDACSDVLDKIADAFEIEWEIVGKAVYFRKVEKLKDNPVPLSYGKGNGLVPGVGRNNLSSSFVINRVFVQGSERNIDRSKYGSAQLHMPANTQITYEGIAYKTNDTGSYIERVNRDPHTVEASIDLTKIYPKRVGTVSQVIVVNADKYYYDIIDSSIPASLDYSQMLIADETMMIAFQTGQLAGLEFEVSYIHAQRRFEIVPTTETGLPLPSGSLIPEVGDQYMIYNIMMPQTYISDAETEMMNEVVKYLYENEQPKFTYTAKLDEIYAKNHWLEIGGFLNAGYFIRLSDPRFLPSPVDIRIVGVKEYINKPQQPELTISNEPTGKGIGSVITSLRGKDQEIDRTSTEVARYSKRQWRDLKQTTDMIIAALDGFTDAISPISVQTMQLIVGDESLQFRFVDSKTDPQPVNFIVNYNTTTKQLSCPSGILQHMTLGLDMSSSHADSEYKFWDVASYISPVLSDPNPAYYFYVKASKTDGTATFLLSQTAIKMEGVAGYYHFLMGIINSEFDDDRSYAQMYGYTEITPGRITVEKIVSPDGKTYFDVLNGIISGRITFINAAGNTQNVADAITELQDEIDGIEVEGDGNQNFRTTSSNHPNPPYKIGDTWSNSIDLRICIRSKLNVTDVYEAADWDFSTKYDNTQTVIDGGILTSGTVQLAGSSENILAGITGNGTVAGSVRMWAGADFANRGTAPFRVLQDGTFYATKAIIEGKIYASDGEFTGKITSTSGSIGGFTIGTDRIGALESQYGMSLYSSIIKFSDSYFYAGMGSNTVSSSTGVRILHRLELTDSRYPAIDNYGLMIRTSGANINWAAYLYGASKIEALHVGAKVITSDYTVTINDTYIACDNSSEITVTLPSSPSLGRILIFKQRKSNVRITGTIFTNSSVSQAYIWDGQGYGAIFVWDGTYWCYNKLTY